MKYLLMLYKAYCDLYFTYLEVNPLGESYGVHHMMSHDHSHIHSGVRWKGTHAGPCG